MGATPGGGAAPLLLFGRSETSHATKLHRRHQLPRHSDLQAAWEAAANPNLLALSQPTPWQPTSIPEQYLILMTCRDEKHQVELLERFHCEGLECKALLS
jgi:hypothetical protein